MNYLGLINSIMRFSELFTFFCYMLSDQFSDPSVQSIQANYSMNFQLLLIVLL